MSLTILVLAAGSSRRFAGGHKLLQDLDGAPLIRHAVRAACGSRATDIAVVTGSQHQEIAAALHDLPVRIVRCATAAEGMGTSIATGVAALEPACDGLVILPGDMPLLTPKTLDHLIAAFDGHARERIVFAANRDGAQRNPVIWPRASFAALRALRGPAGGRSLITSAGGSAVPVIIANIAELMDVDTETDLEFARQAKS